MSRPPHARAAVLAAAETIVKDIGAANLTFDELVRRSGITRGGILYHFPSKDALLESLVEHDIAQWRACLAQKRARADDADGPVVSYIASSTEPDEETARLCAGLLSATSSSKRLTDPWRRYFEEHHAEVTRQSADPALTAVLMLAAEGLFWMETLGLSPLSPTERRKVVERMLTLARSQPEPDTQARDAPARKPTPRRRSRR